MTHAPGTWFLAPANDRSDEWSAGYDGNEFATEAEAIAAIPGMRDCSPEQGAIEWVAVRRPSAYQWATDSASGTVIAANANAALAKLVREHEWPARDAAVIADGAWIWIHSDTADDEIKRGEMP